MPLAQPSTEEPSRTQAARSQRAKQKLLVAATEVLLEKGFNGLSTKEVATRAGLSMGALTHHFQSKSELVVAATASVYDECLLRGQAVARSRAAHDDPIAGFVSDCTAVYFDWPFIAALEITIVSRTDAALMAAIEPVMSRYRKLTNEIWLEVFREVGLDRESAEELLNLTLNVVRGLAVNSIWEANAELRDKLLANWSSRAKAIYFPERLAKPASSAKSL